ncbi:unnamed protein product (macronuclear) [Paramecium tetraurelia]|uniref:Transcriptional coactivator p15 (PC4) C-terminal domain-containing protein n=1 Tax=Paramecium tetraurelia TaxID=5888 RepID=A0CW81_PARTE|nr:uncharacterized protein GSPATT00001250001 [Paramecium tetraurelia]CAK75048.1 unnamed protein product [Paramecium tetraurelia]|eukprot:XP_001442445.1 hypothetical protein (macronuclear) [Paramecium tetraurelia strain d4-2]
MRDRSSSEDNNYPKGSSSAKKQQVQKNKQNNYTFEDGQYFFEVNTDFLLNFKLTSFKKVSVSKFKGNVIISIREFFSKDGQSLPTKKGITLQLDNWEKFKQYIAEIDECVNKLKK